MIKFVPGLRGKDMKRVRLVVRLALLAVVAGALLAIALGGAPWLVAVLTGAAGLLLGVHGVALPAWENRGRVRSDAEYRRRVLLLAGLYLAAAAVLVLSLLVEGGGRSLLPVLSLLLVAVVSSRMPL